MRISPKWGDGRRSSLAEYGGDWVLGNLSGLSVGLIGEIYRRLLGDRFETQERSVAILWICFSSA